MFDTLRPFASDGSAMDSITCAISRRAIGQLRPEVPFHHGVIIDGAWGRLLADYLLSFVSRLPEMNAGGCTDAHRIIRQDFSPQRFKRRSQLAAHQVARSIATARQRVEKYVDQNLSSDELTSGHTSARSWRFPSQACIGPSLTPEGSRRTFAREGSKSSMLSCHRTRRRRSVRPRADTASSAPLILVEHFASEFGF